MAPRVIGDLGVIGGLSVATKLRTGGARMTQPPSGQGWGGSLVAGAVPVAVPPPTPRCPQVFPTLVGDMDSAGSLNAQALQLLGERLRAKAVFQVSPGGVTRPSRALPASPPVPPPCPVPPQTHQAKFVTWQFDGEYRGDDCTATLTLGNPDLLGGSGERRGTLAVAPWPAGTPLRPRCPRSDRGGPFPAERHRPPRAGRRARLPPAPRRGGGHPHAGRQIHG